MQRESDNIDHAGWLIFRFVPILLIVTFAACLSAWLRAKSVFVPGIQGMIVGGITGWIAGLIICNDSEKFQTFSQRIWLSLSMMIIYGAFHLVLLSIFRAGIIDSPLYWLSETANGFMKEPFIGVARHSTRSGMIGGGWWIFFNLLDFGLFAYIFLAFSRIGLTPPLPLPETERDKPSPSTELRKESPHSFSWKGEEESGQESSRSAFSGFVLSVLMLVIAISGYWAYLKSQEGNPFSISTLNEMKSLSGRWKIEQGGEIFGKSEQARTINFEAVGFNMLQGVPDDKTLYSIHLDKRGSSFSGSVYLMDKSRNYGLPIPIRARFSPDGKTVVMVLTTWNIRGRKEVTVTGQRIKQ